LIELMVSTAVLGIVVTIASSFLVSTQNTVNRVQTDSGIADTAALLQQTLAIETRSASVVSPLPTTCSGTTCASLSAVTLLEQTGLSAQECRGWKVVAGSPVTLQDASWAPGNTAGSYSIFAYLSSTGTFSVTTTSAGSVQLSYTFNLSAPPVPTPPSAVAPVQISDTLTARNASPTTSPC
jgi:type II secretory pathway pseudopilin PulG